MGIFSSSSNFFGLDIGNSAVRLVQLGGAGKVKALEKYGAVKIDKKTAQGESAGDIAALAEAIRQLVMALHITSRDVCVGLPNQKIFSTIIDFDKLPDDSMAKAIKNSVDSIIPTPLIDTKLDWAVVGDSPKEKGKVEVLLTSVTNDYIEKKLDMLEDLGLNVVAFEPESLALSRALLDYSHTGVSVLVDVGAYSTDIVIVKDNAPRLIRSLPIGIDTITFTAQSTLGITHEQTKQLIYKFGLSKDRIDGKVINAINVSVDGLMGEIEKSIKFFASRYPNDQIKSIVVTGAAAVVPEMPVYMANRFGLSVEIGNSWRNVGYSSGKESELMAVSHTFAVATGLAQRII